MSCRSYITTKMIFKQILYEIIMVKGATSARGSSYWGLGMVRCTQTPTSYTHAHTHKNQKNQEKKDICKDNKILLKLFLHGCLHNPIPYAIKISPLWKQINLAKIGVYSINHVLQLDDKLYIYKNQKSPSSQPILLDLHQ